MSQAVVDRRIRLLVAAFAIAFAAVLVRAAWLQAVQARSLDRLAASQHRETIAVPAHRGAIFDRTGVGLAIGERATSVYANPREINDPRAVAIDAGRALGIAPARLFPLLSDRSRAFVYLARKADPERVKALRRKEIVGLGFYPEERRTYPLGSVASEVVGYAGLDNRGLSGLELALDPILRGSDGGKTVVRDPFGHALDSVDEEEERDGRDVYLTIDQTLQRHVERVLSATRARWRAAATNAVVLEPRTGNVLAMASEPGFDANRFPNVPRDRQRNRTVTDTYEPGSTFKVVTLSGVLETRLVKPWTKFTLPPSIEVADRVIHDAEERGTEVMTVAEIVSHSSNVGVVTLALMLGRTRLSEWIGRFGFGRETDIEYPGETGGIVPPPERWSGSSIGNIPIGHGIAVTPVQMAAAYAAIANGGVAVEPHLVERVDGGVRRAVRKHRILSRLTAKELTGMLRGVVEDGSGTEARVPGYFVAGKTGTAAKPDPVYGGYSKTRYVGSFVGFVPANRPRVVILVTVDEPRGTIWGGTVAAPAFREIARFALQYLQVPPDDPAALAASQPAAPLPAEPLAPTSTEPPAPTTTDSSVAPTPQE
ncbi:MAG: penicillin-binding protein 2 [Thermoleophilia bacterium]|nr:penicillin-binding protein 2 [Thermoleophilia bacterium]